METLIRVVLLMMIVSYIVLGITKHDPKNPGLTLLAFGIAIICFIVLCWLVRKDK